MGQSPEERALRARVNPIVDDLIVAFGDFTGVFVAESSSIRGNFSGIGSGFLVFFEGSVSIVTAAHVVEEIANGAKCIFGMRETDHTPRQALLVTPSDFVTDPENDIAIAPLRAERLKELGLRRFAALRMATEAPDDPDGITFHCLVGFQGVENAYGGGTIVDKLSAVSLWDFAPKPRASTIADAICFRFLPKSAYVTSGSRYPSRAFDFRGMSGGPLMKLVIPGTGPPALAEIAGVFAEWHRDIPCLAGASRRALLALLADKRA